MDKKKPKVITVKDFYSLGKWNGLTQYKCNQCPFDSLDEKTIKEHIIANHMAIPIKPKVEVEIVDRFKNVIKK